MRVTAAVSCSPDAYRLGGAGLGIWLTGKLDRAWAVFDVVHGIGRSMWCVGILGLVYYLDVVRLLDW